MSKFENIKTEHEEIEKLKQQRLIQSILNRKNLENEALIQAVQESTNKTKEDIEKRKEQIIKDKLEKENQKKQKEISEKLKEIESKEQKNKKMEQKSKGTENRREKIYKTENEKLREQERQREKNVKNINFPKEENNSTMEIVELEKDDKGTLENLKEQLINLFKGNIEKKKKKITNYRIIKGIKRYEENIRFYNQYQREKLFYKMNHIRSKASSKKVTNNFKDIYDRVTIDHNLAIRNAEKNKKSIQNERVS